MLFFLIEMLFLKYDWLVFLEHNWAQDLMHNESTSMPYISTMRTFLLKILGRLLLIVGKRNSDVKVVFVACMKFSSVLEVFFFP